MSAKNVLLRGVLYKGMGVVGPFDVGQEVTFVGAAYDTDLSVGGGPILPPEQPPIKPPGTPEHPIVPPGGYPHPEHPIVLPPEGGTPPTPIQPLPPQPPIQLPPNFTPPPPGTVTPIPVPNQIVQPITPPPWQFFNYPGIGWTLVTAPTMAPTTPPIGGQPPMGPGGGLPPQAGQLPSTPIATPQRR